MNEFPRIDEALAAATVRLEPASDSARLDAEILLARALDVPRSYLFAHPGDRLDAGAVERYSGVVARRADGMPMAYITGEKEFWSMTLYVSPETLVPRPETEIVVERALMYLPQKSDCSVLDLGTGCGAIALALASERPLCRIVATDISPGAVAVARENARRHGLPNVEFRVGDWLGPVAGAQFDIVVSNPPYVASDDPHLEALAFEPRGALDAGPDGLAAIRTIAASADRALASGGRLILEHGAAQGDAVRTILGAAGWSVVETVADLSGLPRVSTAVRR